MWDAIVTNPLSALLLLMYNLFHNYGLAIIMFGLVVKVLLLYFAARGKHSMLKQQRLVPKQKELEARFGKDKVKYNEALQKLYQEEGVSPLGGCLWSLLPLPIFFALYAVMREPLKNLMKLTADEIAKVAEVLGVEMSGNTAFIQLTLAEKLHNNFDKVVTQVPELSGKLLDINFDFFPGFNLAPIPNLPWQTGDQYLNGGGTWNWLLVIPVLSCATAYLSMIISQKINGTSQQQQPGMMKGMMLFMPLISLWIGFTTPAAMGVYWITNNIFSIVQDIFLTKHYTKKMAEEEAHKAELAARRKAAEEQMKEEERLRRLESGESATKNMSQKKKYRLKNTTQGGLQDKKNKD